MEAIKGAAPPPPAQRACLAPQPRESCSQHHPESSRQTGKTHPPSGLGFVGVFPLGYFYLLDKKVESTVLFVSSSNTTQVNPERRVFNDLCLVTRCNVEGSPFSWKLTAKPPWEISVLIFSFHPESSLMNLPMLVQISTCYLTWLKKATTIK